MANQDANAEPDWFAALIEDYNNRFKQNEDEKARQMKAWQGILAGESLNLIKLLKTSNDPIHPYLRFSLIKALEGVDNDLEFKLVFQKTGKLKHKSQSTISKARVYNKITRIGSRVALKGGVKKGEVEAAVHEVSVELNLSRSRVMEYWSQYKKRIRHQLISAKWYEHLADAYGVENNLCSMLELEGNGIDFRNIPDGFRPKITNKELNYAIWLDATNYGRI